MHKILNFSYKSFDILIFIEYKSNNNNIKWDIKYKYRKHTLNIEMTETKKNP